MNEECEELGLVTDILDAKKLRYKVHSVAYDELTLKKYYMHYTVFVPDKENFIFFISFDLPFDGYRFAKGKDYDSRFDKDIDEIEKEVKNQHVRRKV